MPTDTPIDWSKSSDEPEGTEETSAVEVTEEENELSEQDLSLTAQREAQARISRNINGG